MKASAWSPEVQRIMLSCRSTLIVIYLAILARYSGCHVSMICLVPFHALVVFLSLARTKLIL